ncbi:hypothetical protein BDQ17DRAFT_1251133 [Cyathus striatus]|nr:hypothetical protein BDQ17DRAFT_1251133 [Cyathus striatus]
MRAHRNSIRSDLMEALQMLKFLFKNGYHLSFTSGTSRADELHALEENALRESFVPEDVQAFADSLYSSVVEDDNEFPDGPFADSDVNTS